ncbi:MAG: hypothetical protein QOF47_1828 [Mycobacterium sp.]|jgi:hypothetical protein|nr:hypothetical protein [Mycobacterium sp.]MDT5332755.1 hypothetical protein [Mycobacterium sp.]
MSGDTHSSHSASVKLAVSLAQSSSRHLLGPAHSTQLALAHGQRRADQIASVRTLSTTQNA